MSTKVKPARIAQIVFDLLLRIEGDSPAQRLILKIFKVLRAALARAGDPLVVCHVNGCPLVLPISHDFPLDRKWFPEYGNNIARLAAFLERRFPDLSVIDVGANVGDTLALLRTRSSAPVLCIEGSPRYFPILLHNAAHLQPAQVLQSFVGDREGVIEGDLVHDRGTTSITAHGHGQIPIRTMVSILKDYAQFRGAQLLKSDTDGFDAKVLKGARDWLEEAFPVLFFEFDPYLLRRQRDDPEKLLEFVTECGYDCFLAYEEMGDYLLSGTLTDRSLVEDLCLHYTGWGGRRYADLCVFPRTLSELADEFVTAERLYFRRRKRIK